MNSFRRARTIRTVLLAALAAGPLAAAVLASPSAEAAVAAPRSAADWRFVQGYPNIFMGNVMCHQDGEKGVKENKWQQYKCELLSGGADTIGLYVTP
ncbi:hypothetical protein AB0J52_10645 [Spirillospora sp. NPDC049652]